MIHRFRALVFAVMCVMFMALGVISLVGPGRPEPAEGPAVLPKTAVSPPPPPVAAPVTSEDCSAPRDLEAAAQDNAAGLATLSVAPFGVTETGWAVYAPMVAREIGDACAPQTASFASALARWQAAHSLTGAGRMDAATMSALSITWALRRPFVLVASKACPPPPGPTNLAMATPAESFGGKLLLARPAALAAYRRMAAALHGAVPDAPPLRIASAYRGPIEEALRCATGGCGTPGRARCSAHRTGLAFDLMLGNAPGADPFSTDPANRLYLAGTPTYLWLVANADRFGFVNYPYEPWHWEWTGEAA